jgi:membrane associated rhomboid family serine protease
MLLIAGFCFALRLFLAITRPDLSSEDTYIGALQIRLFQASPEVFGMFKLWEGEWWRIFVNPFYHASFGHLFFNTVALWILGGLLEPRLGSRQLIFFCGMSALICSIPESLIEVEAVGLSGIVYAMFGALLVLRSNDEELADRFGKWPITFGIVWLFLCIILTASGVVAIANGAHFAGLIFGIFFTVIQFEISKYSVGFSRFCMLVAILVTSGLVYLTMHPFWLGRYYAWRSTTIPEELYESAKTAIEHDPELPSMWIRLAKEQAVKSQHVESLKILLRGIRANRTNEKLIDFAKFQWGMISQIEKVEILNFMDRLFKTESDAFIANLEFEVGEFVPFVDISNLPLFGDSQQPAPGRLNQPVDLPVDVAGITKPLPAEMENGEVDPEDPQSARLGETF